MFFLIPRPCPSRTSKCLRSPDVPRVGWGRGACVSGQSSEDLVTNNATAVATYDGKRNREGLRHDKFSRSTYPNGDVYWGEYRDTYRNGDGFYLFKGGTTFQGSMVYVGAPALEALTFDSTRFSLDGYNAHRVVFGRV